MRRRAPKRKSTRKRPPAMTTASTHAGTPSGAAAVAVCADPGLDGEVVVAAQRLALELGLPQVDWADEAPVGAVRLVVAAAGLELRLVGTGGRPIRAELTRLDTRSRAGRDPRQPLLKALGVKRRSDQPPRVVDATAGWGQDSWLMASAGCQVLALERHRVVAALLRDAVARAAATVPQVAGRITVMATDACDLLPRLSTAPDQRDLPAAIAAWGRPDVIYLDPMYPPGRKTAERKALKVLRSVVGTDPDAEALLAAALAAAARRVVVKRPLHAAPLGDRPSHTQRGKALRYDVYIR